MIGHGEDGPGPRPRVVGYVDNASDWLSQLPRGDSTIVVAHLYGRIARNPRRALSVEPDIFHTFVSIERGTLRGYRVDFSVTEMAVVVLAGKAIYR